MQIVSYERRVETDNGMNAKAVSAIRAWRREAIAYLGERSVHWSDMYMLAALRRTTVGMRIAFQYPE